MMDFDRAASKLKKEQEKRRQEAVRRLERYVSLIHPSKQSGRKSGRIHILTHP